MGKKVKIIIVVVIVVVFLFIGLPIILLYVSPGTVLKTDPNNITGVSQFYVLKDGSVYNVRFSLVNNQSSVVTSDAHVSFAAKTKSGDVFYIREFDVKSGDFQTYNLVLTGAPITAYAWQITNGTQLSSYQSSGGPPTAYLNVTLPNGKMFRASTTYI
jgi:hypothetical protein